MTYLIPKPSRARSLRKRGAQRRSKAAKRMAMGMKILELRKCADLLLQEIDDNLQTDGFFDLVGAWQDFMRMDAAMREARLRKFAIFLIEDGLDRHDMRIMALMVTEDLKGRNALDTIVERCHKALMRMPTTTKNMREEAPKPVEPEEAAPEEAAPGEVPEAAPEETPDEISDETPDETNEIPAPEDTDPFGIKEHGIRTPDQLVAGGHRKIFGELKHEVEVWMDVKRRPANKYDIPESPKRGRPKKPKTPTENQTKEQKTFHRNRDGP